MPTHDHEPGQNREPAAEQSFWALLPRRNFRRALFLLVALVAIIAIQRMGGFSLGEAVRLRRAGPRATARAAFQHLEVKKPR